MSPKRQKCLYAAFLMMGTATLIPWNAFLAPIDFYFARFPGNYVSVGSMVCNIGQWVFNIFILSYGYKLNVTAMITVPMFVWLAALILLPIIDLILPEANTVKTAVGMIPILGIGIPGAFF